jgi:WD40 repeat protein
MITGEEVGFFNHEAPVSFVEFSPDGHYLLTASDKGIVRLWFWQQEELITEACSRIFRNFTHNEWSQYFGNEPYHKTCPKLPIPTE